MDILGCEIDIKLTFNACLLSFIVISAVIVSGLFVSIELYHFLLVFLCDLECERTRVL